MSTMSTKDYRDCKVQVDGSQISVLNESGLVVDAIPLKCGCFTVTQRLGKCSVVLSSGGCEYIFNAADVSVEQIAAAAGGSSVSGGSCCPGPRVESSSESAADLATAAAGAQPGTIIWFGGTADDPDYVWYVGPGGEVTNVESPGGDSATNTVEVEGGLPTVLPTSPQGTLPAVISQNHWIKNVYPNQCCVVIYVTHDGGATWAVCPPYAIKGCVPNSVVAEGDGVFDLVAGTTTNIAPLVNDSDPDGDTFTITGIGDTAGSIGPIAVGGTFTDQFGCVWTLLAGGTLDVAIPGSKPPGQYDITYEITDSKGNTDTATITVNVEEQPVAKSFNFVWVGDGSNATAGFVDGDLVLDADTTIAFTSKADVEAYVQTLYPAATDIVCDPATGEITMNCLPSDGIPAQPPNLEVCQCGSFAFKFFGNYQLVEDANGQVTGSFAGGPDLSISFTPPPPPGWIITPNGTQLNTQNLQYTGEFDIDVSSLPDYSIPGCPDPIWESFALLAGDMDIPYDPVDPLVGSYLGSLPGDCLHPTLTPATLVKASDGNYTTSTPGGSASVYVYNVIPSGFPHNRAFQSAASDAMQMSFATLVNRPVKRVSANGWVDSDGASYNANQIDTNTLPSPCL